MNFGYLPKSSLETGNLRTEEKLKEAIINLQRMGNIPETGTIDKATHELMQRPRCGQPDYLESDTRNFSAKNRSRRRSRRYVIQGSQWNKTSVTWR